MPNITTYVKTIMDSQSYPPNLEDFKGKTTLKCQILGLTTLSDWGEGVCSAVLGLVWYLLNSSKAHGPRGLDYDKILHPSSQFAK